MSAKIKGLDKLMKKLGQLERAGAKRALRKATRAGTTVLLRAVRAATPVDEGLLRKAQTSKVGGRGLRAFGVVGADADRLKAGEKETGPAQRPANIDHLVEEGHVTPDGKVIPPSGYMRRAADGAMPAAEATFIAKLTAEIKREAGR